MSKMQSTSNKNKISAQFTRTELLLGAEKMKRLKSKRVAIFGIGGVGGYVVEALVRAGIGNLDIIDNDVVDLSNINRQIIALHSTIGKYKVDAAACRVCDINPEIKVRSWQKFYQKENCTDFDLTQYDYIVDAIDTVSSKILLIEQANAAGKPIISAMGAGNRMDATALKVADISKTSVCPLAKVMRKELRKRGIDHLKVVYSTEPAVKLTEISVSAEKIIGSVSYVPAAMGLLIAGEVIKDLLI